MRVVRIAIIIIGCAFLFWYIKSALFNKAEERDIPGSSTGSLTEKVQSFSLEGFSEAGEKIWQIDGRSADIYADVINLSDINADSYGKKTKVNLKSDKGVFSRTDNNLFLNDNVIVVTDDGTRLTTESLKWDAKNELIFTEDRVYIERDDMHAQGLGASAKPNINRAQLNKDVRVDVRNPPAVITCDGPLEIDYKANVAYFNENVRLNDSKAEINADKATAYFDPDKHLLSRVLCEGSVEIRRGKDITRSETLTYLPDEGRVVLEGRPQIIIGSLEEALEEAK